MEPWTLALLVVIVVGLAMVLAGSRAQHRARTDARITARIDAIDRKLDAVAAHLGVTVPVPDQADVVHHLQQGQKIQAVKVYRDRTGVGLAEAKAAVDRIAADRGLGR